jgi:hypothetical protein
MSVVAVFDVVTNLNPEVIKSKLIELWIWKQVDIIVDSKTGFITCILEYIFDRPEEEQSIKDIVKYLLNVSNNGCIYYYPSWECYEYDEEDKDIEISIDDVCTEKYKPSLCGWGMKFLIKKPELL